MSQARVYDLGVPTFAVFQDPALNAPSGIIGAAGDVWFTNIGDNRVGRIRDEKVEIFADPAGAVKFPANIFPGSDGRVWFTSLGSDALVAIDPRAADPSSTITSYPLPEGSKPVALKSGPDGLLWFSLRGINAIGCLDPRAAAPTESLRVVTSPTIAGPAALFVTPEGTVWWVNSSTNTIGGLDPKSGEVGVIEHLTGTARAWAQTSDGTLWVTTREPAGLLSFDPADPLHSVRHVTGDGVAEPDGVWVGADGALWFADTGANAIGRYSPEAGTWTFFGAPPEVDGPFDIKAGPDPSDGNLWFTNKTGNSLGRISITG